MIDKILTEKDPFLREIWAHGYDEVVEQDCGQTLVLVQKKNRFVKKISRYDLINFKHTIKRGLLPNGEIHEWLCESDGSCARFLELIKNNDFIVS
jgi:hypothetical protein